MYDKVKTGEWPALTEEEGDQLMLDADFRNVKDDLTFGEMVDSLAQYGLGLDALRNWMEHLPQY